VSTAAPPASDSESIDLRAWFETLDEEHAAVFLLQRFRWFIGAGHDVLDALMLATRATISAP
jgi:hypothetical protein